VGGSQLGVALGWGGGGVEGQVNGGRKLGASFADKGEILSNELGDDAPQKRRECGLYRGGRVGDRERSVKSRICRRSGTRGRGID